ncbi:hypothetical protein AXF42_Ash013190 [Apostasia shenzhenica]|uniref:Uncharacterized protein n=1 Tax=Apostasia shenzhenica TaxID=1088818 RepID=A0A2I0BDC1_9ASPA|nr:hypothetical protein AXF42_Ash013190 [Apostasia shenzhenica]
MAVVDEAGSLAGEALNPHADRELDLARGAAVEAEADRYSDGGGLHQVPFLRPHQYNGFSTSSGSMVPFRGTVQLQQQHRGLQMGTAIGRNGDDELRTEIGGLEELLSKLNPMAEEFVPSSLASPGNGGGWLCADGFGVRNGNSGDNSDLHRQRQKKSNLGNGRRRMNTRTSLAQREEVIRRTIYVSDIDHQVTEEQLATLFINCGHVRPFCYATFSF